MVSFCTFIYLDIFFFILSFKTYNLKIFLFNLKYTRLTWTVWRWRKKKGERDVHGGVKRWWKEDKDKIRFSLGLWWWREKVWRCRKKLPFLLSSCFFVVYFSNPSFILFLVLSSLRRNQHITLYYDRSVRIRCFFLINSL